MPGPGYGYALGSERTIVDVASMHATAGPATTVTPAPTFATVAATSNGNGNGHIRGVSNDYGRVVMPSPSTSEYSDVDVTDWVRRTTQGGRSVSNPTITNAGTPERDLASNTNVKGNTTPNGKRVPTQLFETPPSSTLYPYRIEQTPPAMHAHSHSYPTYEQNGNNNVHGGLTSGPSSPPASSRSKHSFAETPSGDLSNHNLLNGSPLQPMRDVMGLGPSTMTSMSAAMNMNTRGDIAAAMAMLNDNNAARNGSPAAKGAAGTGVTPMLSRTANGGPGSAGTNRSAITATRLPTFFDDDNDDGEDEDDLGVPLEDSPKSQIRVLGPSPERQTQSAGLNGSGKNTRRKSGPFLPSFHCRLCFSDPCEEPTATVCGHIFCNR